MNEEVLCKKCFHPGSMHSDGVEWTHTGECHMELTGKVGREVPVEELEFCGCKKFEPPIVICDEASNISEEDFKKLSTIKIKPKIKGCGKNWSIWNDDNQEYDEYVDCRTDILCPSCSIQCECRTFRECYSMKCTCKCHNSSCSKDKESQRKYYKNILLRWKDECYRKMRIFDSELCLNNTEFNNLFEDLINKFRKNKVKGGIKNV